MRARASHPRTFLMLCILTMIIILVAYSILILFPSYQSGVYNSTDPNIKPLYRSLVYNIPVRRVRLLAFQFCNVHNHRRVVFRATPFARLP